MNPKHKRRYHTELTLLIRATQKELSVIHRDAFEPSPSLLVALKDTLEAGIRLATALEIDGEVRGEGSKSANPEKIIAFDIKKLKPSDYLSAMVRGLKNHAGHPSFILDMSVFASVSVENGQWIMHGDAATATIAELQGVLYPDVTNGLRTQSKKTFDEREFEQHFSHSWYALQEHGYIATGLSLDDLDELQKALDWAAMGELEPLFDFSLKHQRKVQQYETTCKWSLEKRWHLESDDWEGQLPIVEATIVELQSVGL